MHLALLSCWTVAAAGSSGPPLRPGPAKPPAPPCAPGQRRVECASATFDAPPVSTPSSFIIDGPFIGNGNLGAAMSALDQNRVSRVSQLHAEC
jgi:hypothetical protein